MPNPFNRPRAVFMLEVRGVDGLCFWYLYACNSYLQILSLFLGLAYKLMFIHADPSLRVKGDSIFSSAYGSKVVFDSKKVEIQLPGIPSCTGHSNCKVNILTIIWIIWIIITDEDEVAVVSLDEPLADCTDKEISDFVSNAHVIVAYLLYVF